MTKRNWLILAGTVSALVLLGILSSIFYPRLNAWLQGTPSQAISLNADPTCNPVGRFCTVSNEALSISLSLGESIRPLSAFPIQVRLAGKKAEEVNTVTVHFTMPEMDMGINRFSLEPQAAEQWAGKAMLPVCRKGRRDWQVTVQLKGDKNYLGKFHLLIDS